MANYKRGKCRYHCPKAIRGSQTSFRAKYGFKPIRIADGDIPDWDSRHTSATWDAMWHPRGRAGNRGHKIGGQFSMMSRYPAWWDRMFHTRPRRAKERTLLRKVKSGYLDADETVWPVANHKPHAYYW